MADKQKYYITTAIPYASGKPHFGNTYEVIATDALARFKRAEGYEVYFCTGTDCHGQKIEDKAKEAGVTPREYAMNVSNGIQTIWDKMHTTYDYFIHTSDPDHEAIVAKMFKRLYDQGDIYKGYYEGWYCVPDEAFFTDSQVTDGKCPECGRPLVKGKEEAYFFILKKYADKLLAYAEEHPDFIQPEFRKKEMINNFLKVEGGLQDLCVTRTTIKWGVQTFDPDHVIYVWMDALSNYITALGYDPDKTFEQQSEHFKKYWPADLQVIGKDILRFHFIYWPIFLMALDLPLPKQLFVHPWFLFGTDKMSKSRGNVIYADELAERFGLDCTRYYAIAEMPYANDGSITYENVIKRFNTDLVNNLGNLVKRTLDMQKKYFDKVIMAPTVREPIDDELRTAALAARDGFIANMESFHMADALACVFELLGRANKYIDETTPWTLAKDESKKERLGTVLYELLCSIRWAAILLHPIIPDASMEILRELNCTDILTVTEVQKKAGEREYVLLDRFASDDAFEAMVPGAMVNDSTVLFARLDEEKVLAELEAERQAKAEAAKEPEKPEKPEGCALIGIEDFMNVELRTAKVVACEKVPKAKKLLKLQLDLGYEQRQVVSGIAKFYEPEDLIGKKVIIVANLKPATLCGIESNGMILASGEEQIRVVFLAEDTPLGERVR